MLDTCVIAMMLAAGASPTSDDQPAFAVIKLPMPGSLSPDFEETRGELLRLRGLLCTAWAEKRALDVWVLYAGVDTSSREKLHLAPLPTGDMSAELINEDRSLTFDRMILLLPDRSEVEVKSRSDCAAIVSAPVVLRNPKVGSRESW